MSTLGSDPTSVQSTEQPTDDELKAEAAKAPIYQTMLRASIGMRGHLVASLTTMREMYEAAKAGDLKAVKMLGLEA